MHVQIIDPYQCVRIQLIIYGLLIHAKVIDLMGHMLLYPRLVKSMYEMSCDCRWIGVCKTCEKISFSPCGMLFSHQSDHFCF